MVSADGVRLCVETFGEPSHPTVLLISGLAASMDWWDIGFCERLATKGLLVVRYDHRDTGRSTSYPPREPAYDGNDLSEDAIRVLDALAVPAAHVVGISAGGGIAQELAVQYPTRLLTVTLMATSPAGARVDEAPLPSMEPRVAVTFEHPTPDPAWDDREAVVEHLVELQRAYAGSAGFDEDRVRALAGDVVDRTINMEASLTNHWVLEHGSSPEFRLAEIKVPTLVLHGTSDPLFPIGHGEALAREIPGALLVRLEGMGHEVPPPRLWEAVVAEIVQHIAGGHRGS